MLINGVNSSILVVYACCLISIQIDRNSEIKYLNLLFPWALAHNSSSIFILLLVVLLLLLLVAVIQASRSSRSSSCSGRALNMLPVQSVLLVLLPVVISTWRHRPPGAWTGGVRMFFSIGTH
jgi:hypothetical protein